MEDSGSLVEGMIGADIDLYLISEALSMWPGKQKSVREKLVLEHEATEDWLQVDLRESTPLNILLSGVSASDDK